MRAHESRYTQLLHNISKKYIPPGRPAGGVRRGAQHNIEAAHTTEVKLREPPAASESNVSQYVSRGVFERENTSFAKATFFLLLQYSLR